jgi:hypothetical protein
MASSFFLDGIAGEIGGGIRKKGENAREYYPEICLMVLWGYMKKCLENLTLAVTGDCRFRQPHRCHFGFGAV